MSTMPRLATRSTAAAMAAVLFASTVLSGCATTKDGQMTQAGGAGAGALIGGLLGAVIGGRQGAIIGAGLGAAAGLAVGTEIANRKAEYASQQAFYDAQISNTERFNAELASLNGKLDTEVSHVKMQLAALKKQAAAGRSTRAEAAKTQKRIDVAYEHGKKALTQAQQELGVQKDVLADATNEEGEKANHTRQIQAQVQTLEAYVGKLDQQVNLLAGMRNAPSQYQ